MVETKGYSRQRKVPLLSGSRRQREWKRPWQIAKAIDIRERFPNYQALIKIEEGHEWHQSICSGDYKEMLSTLAD
jgi:hypothetical protein